MHYSQTNTPVINGIMCTYHIGSYKITQK